MPHRIHKCTNTLYDCAIINYLYLCQFKVKGKLANGVGSQYSSHFLGTWCIQHYYR